MRIQEMLRKAKREMAKTREKLCDKCFEKLDTVEGDRDLNRSFSRLGW